jgi:predicted Zn-dependent peptidase
MASEFALKAQMDQLHRKLFFHNELSVGVFVGAGSRNEDIETSGTSYALQNMLMRGTSAQSKGEIGEEIESMGAKFDSKTTREVSHMELKVFKNDVSKAVKLLG